MKPALINLNRTLFKAAEPSEAESSAEMARALGKLLTWADVLQSKFSLLRGDANSGKTSELQLQVESLRSSGAHACFVPLKDLLLDGTVEHALKSENAAALAAWLKEPSTRLYLFIDSIDEAVFNGPLHLRVALRKLVEKVAVAPEQVTWVLSSRPAVLNPEVRDTIADALGVSVPTLSMSPGSKLAIASAAESKVVSKSGAEKDERRVTEYMLTPLTRQQAQSLLEIELAAAEVPGVMEAAKSYGLAHLLDSPGKCRLLSRMDLLKNPPVSLEQIYGRSVQLHLDAPSGGRARTVPVRRETLKVEASRIAAASTLCERLNIDLPSEDGIPSNQTLAARTIVRTLLDTELQYLLSGDFFTDSGLQQVKMQPDDVRFYLAARHLAELVHGYEDAKKVAQVIGWTSPTGERGIFVPFIPLAGWLATLNQYFRVECMDLDPQCVAFFGDLRSVPPIDAQAALTAAFKELVAGNRIGRGAYSLTSENFWQAGGPALLPHLSALFTEHGANEDARELLLDIAGTVRSSVLREQALSFVGRSYPRILADGDLLEYLLVAGGPLDKARLKIAALKQKVLPERSLRLLLKHCAWTLLDADDIAKLVRPFAAASERSYMLSYAISHEIAPAAPTEQLLKLLAHVLNLAEGISSSSVDEDLDSYEQARQFADIAVELLDELLQRPLKGTTLKSTASLVVRFQTKMLDSYSSPSPEIKSLRQTLLAPGHLRAEVVRKLLQLHKSDDESALWAAFVSGSVLVCPTLEEARSGQAERLTKVLLDYEAALERGKSKPQQPPARRAIKASAQNRTELSQREANIRAGRDINALSWVAQVLASHSAVSRYSAASISAFESAYGAEITAAVTAGMKVLWRSTKPRRDETNPRSTYWSTIAGLQGLHIELSAVDAPSLTKREVQRALDYGLHELNGVPTWFWQVVASDISEATKFLRRTVKDWNKGAVSKERASKVLSLLAEAPSEIRSAMTEDAWTAVREDRLDHYQLDNVLSVLVENGLVSSADFVKEALKQVLASPADPKSAVWAAHGMLLDASSFMNGLSKARTDSGANFDKLLSAVATALEDGQGPSFQELSKRSSTSVEGLKTLYQELRRVVPPAQDEPRLQGKVYEVLPRDRAQRTRDRIPGMLASARTTAGYLALMELREQASEERERQYFSALMYQTAEAMQRRPRAMIEDEFLEFERTLQAPVTDLDAFALQVERDLQYVREIVEVGEFSPRRFLATWVQDMDAGAVKAMEAEFQLFLAGQLAVVGRNRYAVFREPQGADDTRRDISVSHPGQEWKATLELKVTEGSWTLEQYRHSLRHQLVGLYMQERKTTVGFLVILRQTRRGWAGPDGELDYEGLLAVLRADALEIQRARPELRLRVVGIDATEPLKLDGTPVRATAASKAAKAAKKAAKKGARGSAPARSKGSVTVGP